MRSPTYKKKDVILITRLSCRQDVKFNELSFTPYAHSPIKALDDIIWITLLSSARYKATGAHVLVLSFYVTVVPIKSLPALTANTEPVTGFIGRCRRGSEYLGLETELFFSTSPKPQKVTTLSLSFSDEDTIKASRSTVT